MSLTQILRTDATADWGFVNLPINCANKSDVNWPWKYWVEHRTGFPNYDNWKVITDNATETNPDGYAGVVEIESGGSFGSHIGASYASLEVVFAYIATDPVPVEIQLIASCAYTSGDNIEVFQGRGLIMDIKLFDIINFVDVPVTYLLDWTGDFLYYEQQIYSGQLPATAIPKAVYIRCKVTADKSAEANIFVNFPST
jgi:hypothetical protein